MLNDHVSVKQEEDVVTIVGEGSSSVCSLNSASPPPTASSSPVVVLPMEGLHEIGPPPFLTKTYDMVEDPHTNSIVSWSKARNSFVVWDSHDFSTTLLPKYFKHSNFSSFIRQLNTYGFRKVDSEKWEFANEWFLGGQKHLLKNIKRRRHIPKNTQQGGGGGTDGCVDYAGGLGLESEVDALRKERSYLMVEILNLREKQKRSLDELVSIQERLQGTERKQQLTMSFLAKAFKNPAFVQQLIEMSEKKKELTGGVAKKRRLPPSGSIENFQNELVSAAMDTVESGPSVLIQNQKMDSNTFNGGANSGDIDDKYWNELLIDDFMGANKAENVGGHSPLEIDAEVEDFWCKGVHGLVEEMAYLGSTA
ncbi:hypothetical protein MKW92_032213 [Papaver armeniacum]|nr:hypothetical protein MKW92_032213 [Papaver armeniacum]